MLWYRDGEPFATGVQPYLFRPATAADASKRLIIEVVIQGQRTLAVLDTGAPYMICHPDIARGLGIDREAALIPKTRLLIRGAWIDGSIDRLEVTLRAAEGEELTISSTAFIPELEDDRWPGLPSIIGLEGCLERIRFAVDTVNNDFYFGPHP